MRQYHDALRTVLEQGQESSDRTGTGTLSVLGYQTTPKEMRALLHFNQYQGHLLGVQPQFVTAVGGRVWGLCCRHLLFCHRFGSLKIVSLNRARFTPTPCKAS